MGSLDQFVKLEGEESPKPGPEKQGADGFWLIEEAKVLLRKIQTVDWNSIIKSPFFVPAIVATVGLLLTCWTLFGLSFAKWKSDDYYSHGFIVPLLIAWQIKVRKPLWDEAKLAKSNLAWVALMILLAMQYIAVTGEFWAIQSGLFVLISLTCCWAIFGFKKAWVLTPPILFSLFALPVWGSFIDSYTNPLQLLSTQVAYTLLKLLGFGPMMFNKTDIQLNSFTLNVAIPCSGLKLLVAVSCLTLHFILIARSGKVFNAMMLALVLPLCLFMNGLRIALIGIVGEYNGKDAAMQFHDYSGMIMLVLCFWALFKFAKIFGWKG